MSSLIAAHENDDSWSMFWPGLIWPGLICPGHGDREDHFGI